MSHLIKLDRADLIMLLAIAPPDRIGAIIRLNRTALYANTLNVVEILVQLAELSMSRASMREAGWPFKSDSSPGLPASSGSGRTAPAPAR